MFRKYKIVTPTGDSRITRTGIQ